MDHSNDMPPVKFKVHRSFTTKQLSSKPAKWSPRSLSENSRVVRIYFTDSDATDSSSDDDDEQEENRKIKKKYISEITIRSSAEKLLENRNGVVKEQQLERPAKKNVDKIVPPNCQKYRGVQRRRGKWGAEIRDNGCRIWLGVYDTAEEAAFVYNNAAIQLKGAKALTEYSKSPVQENIPTPAVVGCALENEVESPTLVIDDDWKPTEEVELIKDGVWGLDDFDSCCLSSSSPLIFDEMMSKVEDRRFLNDEESISFDFVQDLQSCSWDVEDFFENHI